MRRTVEAAVRCVYYEIENCRIAFGKEIDLTRYTGQGLVDKIEDMGTCRTHRSQRTVLVASN